MRVELPREETDQSDTKREKQEFCDASRVEGVQCENTGAKHSQTKSNIIDIESLYNHIRT